MNILYVVPYVPNLIRVRSYNLIKHLTARGHRVTVAAIGSNNADKKDADQLKQFCHNVWYFEQSKWMSLWKSFISLPTGNPLQSVYSWQRGIADRMFSLIQSQGKADKFDIIHVEHLRGSRYGTYLKNHQDTIPILLDSVDCISYLFEQASSYSQSLFGKMITKIELNRTRRYEANIPHYFDHVVVTSKVDQDALMGLVRNGLTSPVSILPNGVDIEYFSPNNKIPRTDNTIIFSGKMSYHANITMALNLVNHIMPHIWEIKPEINLLIVGKDPSPEVKALAKHPEITVTGTVKDIRPYLWQATIAVVPLIYGAGSQLKLLEAMACGLPVVATPRAALPLGVNQGEEILLAEQPKDFADAVLSLLTSREKREKIALLGLKYVRQNHDWTNIAAILEEIYTETIDQFVRSS